LVILNTVQSAAVLAERFREAGQDVMPMCNRGLNLLVALTFLLLLDSLGAAYTFWLYAAVGVSYWIFAYWLVPETKGRTLEEINERLRIGFFRV